MDEKQRSLANPWTSRHDVSMEQNWVALAEAIKTRRQHLGLSRPALAARAHVSRQTIHNLESGEGFVRVPPTLSRVTQALEWPADLPFAILDGGAPDLPSGEDDLHRGRAFPPLTEDVVRQVVTSAMVAATEVTAGEIREVGRLVVEDMRRRRLIPEAPEQEDGY
jgi:transcriptional regulator with XRE-family HTH domain